MTIAPARSLHETPAARVTLVMCGLFAAWGVAGPFFPRWLEAERGLTGVEIGAVLAAPQLARLVVGMAIASWADGFADRRAPLRILSALTVLAYIALFTVAHGFWALLALAFVATTLGMAIGPLIEAAALRACQTGPIPFGVARAIGSAAFVFANIAGGALVGAAGVGVLPLWVACALSVVALASWILAADRSASVTPGFRARLRRGLAFVQQKRIVLLLLGCGLIQAAHAFYYGFSTLLWRGQGVAESTIGLLWAVAVIVEVGFLLGLTRIERFIAPETMIIAGGMAALVRWSLLGFAPPESLLWPIQALHALSFAAAHVGVLRILTREAPEDVAALSQTLYAALHAGLFMGLATLAGGWLYDHVGVQGYLAMAAMAAAGLALVVQLRRA